MGTILRESVAVISKMGTILRESIAVIFLDGNNFEGVNSCNF